MTAPGAPGPTGLDYQAAFAAMYPGLQGTKVKIHEVNDAALKIIQRAAALRKAERERVKAAFLELAERLDGSGDVPGAGDEIRRIAEETR